MEAEADLVNFGRKPQLEAEFDGLMMDEEIEAELHNLKSAVKKHDQNAPVSSGPVDK
jgi:phage shock protein A